MRRSSTLLGLAALALVAGCTSKATVAPATITEGGWTRYPQSRVTGSFPCAGMPAVIEGNRNAIRLTGSCRQVRVAGDHNDIHVEVAPGGTIEITGGHNDVTWHQVGEGPKPVLSNVGAANDFHRGEPVGS